MEDEDLFSQETWQRHTAEAFPEPLLRYLLGSSFIMHPLDALNGIRVSFPVPDKMQLGSLLLVPANQKDNLYEPQSNKGTPWLRLSRGF